MMADVQTTHLFQVVLLLPLPFTLTRVCDTRRRSHSEQAANQSEDALIEPWAEVNTEQFQNPPLSFCVSIINPWLALIAHSRAIRTQHHVWRRRLHHFLSLPLSFCLFLSLAWSQSLVFMSFKSRFSLPNKPNIWWQSIRLPASCVSPTLLMINQHRAGVLALVWGLQIYILARWDLCWRINALNQKFTIQKSAGPRPPFPDH